MADNVNPSPEKVLETNPNLPDMVSDSSSSDDGTSTKSTEMKATTDDAATMDSELSTPAKESSESSSNKEDTSRSQSPQPGSSDLSGAVGSPGAVGGQRPAGAPGSEVSSPGVEQEAGENDPLLPRRRVREQAQGDEEQIEAIVPVPDQVIVVDPARRSPTSRRFLSSLSERFEFSNEYIVYLLSKWQAFSLFASDSRYLVFVQLCLIAVSIANVCIGAVYLHNCPLFHGLPILLIVVGLSGIMAMIARMVLVLYKFYTTDEVYSRLLRKVVSGMNCIYLIALTWEFTDYMLCDTPAVDVNDSKYCHPFLLSYIIGYNCAAFTIVLLSLILHGPAYLFYSWNIGGPGLPDS